MFGAVLRDRRQKSGLSQEELAHRAQTSQSYLSLLEKGERSPSLTTVALLAKGLGVTMTTLVREVERRLDA